MKAEIWNVDLWNLDFGIWNMEFKIHENHNRHREHIEKNKSCCPCWILRHRLCLLRLETETSSFGHSLSVFGLLEFETWNLEFPRSH